MAVSVPVANIPVSQVTGLQADLNKISSLVVATSGVSPGDSAPATAAAHRIACYESNTVGYTPGSYYYGVGLVVNQTQGLGLWGGTGAGVPEQGTGSNVLPHMLLTSAGRVGIQNKIPLYTLDVNGTVYASTSIASPTKNFDIEHPDPDKASQKYRLRHWCVESDEIGGNMQI